MTAHELQVEDSIYYIRYIALPQHNVDITNIMVLLQVEVC